MPLYDYRCEHCDLVFEVRHALSAPTPACPDCGRATVKTVLCAPAVHGHMALGREQAVQSLQPTTPAMGHRHGPGCGCAHH